MTHVYKPSSIRSVSKMNQKSMPLNRNSNRQRTIRRNPNHSGHQIPHNPSSISHFMSSVVQLNSTGSVFTGNEENGYKGAQQASSFFKRTSCIFLKLRFILSLDLTNDFYGKKHFTIENVSFGNHRMGSLYELTSNLHKTLPSAGFPPLSAPDDSLMYAKQKLTSFSLCLPCKNIHQSMHDEQGVSIKINSISHFAYALRSVLNNTNNL